MARFRLLPSKIVVDAVLGAVRVTHAIAGHQTVLVRLQCGTCGGGHLQMSDTTADERNGVAQNCLCLHESMSFEIWRIAPRQPSYVFNRSRRLFNTIASAVTSSRVPANRKNVCYSNCLFDRVQWIKSTEASGRGVQSILESV